MIGQLKTGRRFLFRYALALALALCAIAACNNTLNEYKDGSYFVGSQRMITWAKTYGGSFEDAAMAITQTPDGGYAVAGYSFSNDGDVTGNHGMADFWVVKVDSDGNLQWQRNYGGSGDDRANDIKQTRDGGYIVAGYSRSADGDVPGNYGDYDFWILKLASDGSIDWSRNYGGSDEDEAFSIDQTSDGGYAVAGYSRSNDNDVSGNHAGSIDIWIVKLNAMGALERMRSIGGDDIDSAVSIQQTSNGGYVIAGYTMSTNGDLTGTTPQGLEDLLVVTVDSLFGNLTKVRLGGSGYDRANSVRQLSDGSFIVAGYTESTDGTVSGRRGTTDSDIWVVKLSASLAFQWQQCFGGSHDDSGESIRVANDGGYIIAGFTDSGDGDVTDKHAGEDAWIIKITSSGTVQWQKCFGGSDNEITHSVTPTADGGYIAAGYTLSTDGDITFNHGTKDFFLVKVNDWGNW